MALQKFAVSKSIASNILTMSIITRETAGLQINWRRHRRSGALSAAGDAEKTWCFNPRSFPSANGGFSGFNVYLQEDLHNDNDPQFLFRSWALWFWGVPFQQQMNITIWKGTP